MDDNKVTILCSDSKSQEKISTTELELPNYEERPMQSLHQVIDDIISRPESNTAKFMKQFKKIFPVCPLCDKNVKMEGWGMHHPGCRIWKMTPAEQDQILACVLILGNKERTLQPHEVNGIQRRVRVEWFTPIEKSIHDTIAKVEQLGADVRLTETVVLLTKAREKLSDYLEDVDEQNRILS